MRDHHNELRVSVAEGAAPNRQFVVAFRVFDDGVGFRYELPQQPNLGEFAITDELTQFALADDARAWWIPSNRARMDRSEMLYSSSPVSGRLWPCPGFSNQRPSRAFMTNQPALAGTSPASLCSSSASGTTTR